MRLLDVKFKPHTAVGATRINTPPQLQIQSVIVASPDDQLEQADADLRQTAINDLLELLATVSPGFFETVFLIYCIAWDTFFRGRVTVVAHVGIPRNQCIWPACNGRLDLTATDCWSPSGTSRLHKPKQTTTGARRLGYHADCLSQNILPAENRGGSIDREATPLLSPGVATA